MTKKKPARRGQRKVMGMYVQEQHVLLLLHGGAVLACGALLVAVFAI